MNRKGEEFALRELPREVELCRQRILGELGERSRWLIRLRWWIPPSLGLATLFLSWVGVEFEALALLGIGIFICGYNVFFYLRDSRLRSKGNGENIPSQRLIAWQVGFDYVAIFLIVFYTGGISSPFIFLFLFHVILTAILLPKGWARLYAGGVPSGLLLIGVLQSLGSIPVFSLVFQSQKIALAEHPFQGWMVFLFFTGFVLIISFSVSGVMAVFRERVTELADLSRGVTMLCERLEGLMEERSRFMRKVAHNLRAPLAAVTSGLEVLEGSYLGDLNEAQRNRLRRITERVRNLVQMVNELMLLARSRMERKEMEWRPVDLDLIGRRIEQTYRAQAEKKGLTFSVERSEGLPPLMGDEEMIEELVENLVSNAVKYTEAPGQVLVRFLKEANGEVNLEVRDTGIGIPVEDQSRLFTEFHRGRNVRKLDGTGLGLAIVKEVVDRHGGRITIGSEEGKGTTVRVYLPTRTRV
jgi:signal transduction histidine kinase